MKRISTLIAVIVLSITQSFAQVSTPFFEGFESLASLSANGWTATNLSIVTNNTIGGLRNVQLESANNAITTGRITTPDITFLDENITVSFKYKVTNAAAFNNGASYIIEFGWVDATNTFTSVQVINVANNANAATHVYNTTATLNEVKKLELRLTTNNGKNSHLLIDDINIAATVFAPLPIKLLSFGGNTHNNKAQLKWSVDENETGDHFVIEKSADGKNFSEAGVVFVTPKAGTESYSFNEASEMTSASYFRLKIVNKNNSVSYSRIIALRAVKANGNSLSIMQNPVRSTLAINYTVSSAGLSEINLYNAAGIKVFATKQQSQKGINATSFNLESNITPGTYVLEVINGTERNIAKLVKL